MSTKEAIKLLSNNGKVVKPIEDYGDSVPEAARYQCAISEINTGCEHEQPRFTTFNIKDEVEDILNLIYTTHKEEYPSIQLHTIDIQFERDVTLKDNQHITAALTYITTKMGQRPKS